MNKTILIKNALIFTGGKNFKLLENYALLIENNKIKKIAPQKNFKGKYNKIIDGKNKILMPSFINTHMHFYSTFARGLNNIKPSKNFLDILENLWWKLDKKLSLDATYYSALIMMIEAIKKGTTTFIDHHASPFNIKGSLFEIEKAREKTKLRANLCYEVSDRDGKGKRDEGIEENLSFIKYAKEKNDNFTKALFGLHASFTLSDETLEKVVSYEKAYNCGFHIHCAESVSDQLDCETTRNMRVVERFEKFNILKEKTILAHCLHINDKEINILKSHKSTIVHNPQSNANNSVGIFDLVKISKNNILVGLGTDAMTVNMLEELRSALWLQHLKNNPSQGFNECVNTLLINNSIIINKYFEKIGEIKEDYYADLILIDYLSPTLINTNNFYGHLVFGLSQSQVDTTIVNGKILMENKKIKLDLDLQEIYRKSKEISNKIWKQF